MTKTEVKKTRKAVHTFASSPSKPLVAANTSATGAALATMHAQRNEYDEYGWRVEGEPRVLRYDVLGTTAKPEGLLVAACVDDSGVRIFEKNGAEVNRGKRAPALTIYTLVSENDHWVVADVTFPDDSSC